MAFVGGLQTRTPAVAACQLSPSLPQHHSSNFELPRCRSQCIGYDTYFKTVLIGRDTNIYTLHTVGTLLGPELIWCLLVFGFSLLNPNSDVAL